MGFAEIATDTYVNADTAVDELVYFRRFQKKQVDCEFALMSAKQNSSSPVVDELPQKN